MGTYTLRLQHSKGGDASLSSPSSLKNVNNAHTHTHTHNEKVHNCTTTCILSDQTKYYTTPGIHSYIYLYTNIPSHFYIINKRNVLLHAKKKKKKKNFFLQKKKKKKKKKKK